MSKNDKKIASQKDRNWNELSYHYHIRAEAQMLLVNLMGALTSFQKEIEHVLRMVDGIEDNVDDFKGFDDF